ncbi:uncharacterized protein LOC133823769 [Humulus lupulus]|uniref:uncharacterized protein LOC133823769 n=1 Tax=Humulus lupulus TaxID=3486 RepID=UPI002B416CA5|nr:uncharacterized protein LOC133823769 [Humulus lupulus]
MGKFIHGFHYWLSKVRWLCEHNGDRFSKYSTFVPALTNCTAEVTARLFLKNIVKFWGIPSSIISDRDPRFTGRFWTELFKLLGTDLNFSTSFHPQTDEQTERVNSLVELYLRHYVSANQKNWASLLDVAQFSYNLQRSESTNKSPFELVMGMQPQTPRALVTRYDGQSPAAFRIGQVVYKLQLPPQLKIHPVFHVSMLKPYHGDEEDPERGVSKRAPTAMTTSYDKEVECVLADREVRKKRIPRYTEYLIKWKNLPDEEASWEPESLLWQFRDHILRYKDGDATGTSRT